MGGKRPMVDPVQPTRPRMITLFTAVILSTLAAATVLHAQEDAWVGTLDEEDLHAIAADLDGLRMDLNRVGTEDLQTLPWISTEGARRIVAHRTRSGPFRSVDDLVRVRGISWETVEAVRPYLFVSALQRTAACSSWRLTRPSGGRSGWTDLRVHHRTDLEVAGLLEGYLLTERDPGEGVLTDFWSGYLLTTAVPGFTRVLVGDFRPAVGQGILLSRQSRTPMGLAWVRPSSSSRIGNRSSTENGSLRGLFAEARTGRLTWTAIYSRAAWDAVEDTAGVAHLRLGGEHVSQAQRERKDALKERLTALRLAGEVASARLGILIMRTIYATPLSGTTLPLSDLDQISVDGSLGLRRVTLFGEFAGGVGHAWLAGAAGRFGALRIRALARRYSPTFLSLRGAAFSAYSGPPGNEQGQFLGATWMPGRTTRIHAEVDRHGRIRPAPPMAEPTHGYRSSASVRQRAGPLEMQISLSSREKTISRSGVEGPQWRRSVRAVFSTRGARRVRGWFEGARGGSPSGSGAGRAAGFSLRLRAGPGIDFSVLGAMFQVNTYDARIYVSEPDVWGGNRLVVLSGRGQVAGLRIGWRSRWCRATGRYSLKHRETGTASSWALQIQWGGSG